MNLGQMGAFFSAEFHTVTDHDRQVIGRYFDANSDVDFDAIRAIGVDAIANLYWMLPASTHRIYAVSVVGIDVGLYGVSLSGDYTILPQQETRRFHELVMLNFVHPHARIHILNFRSFIPPVAALAPPAAMEAAAMEAAAMEAAMEAAAAELEAMEAEAAAAAWMEVEAAAQADEEEEPAVLDPPSP